MRLTEEAAEVLKKNRIKPSHQRIVVLEYLMTHFTHPTVDEIYRDVHEDIPTLSRTTVYNTVSQFLGSGILRVINIEDNEIRYDINIEDHGHFKCMHCGDIYDFTVDMAGINAGGLDGFAVVDKNVYFKGLCPACIESLHFNS